MPFTQVRVTRTYLNAQGNPQIGFSPTLMLSEQITDGGTETITPSPIVCTVSAEGVLTGPDGSPGVLLCALDDPTTLPQNGPFYGITDDGPVSETGTNWNFIIHAAQYPTVDLASLEQAPLPDPVYPNGPVYPEDDDPNLPIYYPTPPFQEF